jgi:hypothetical protein
VQRNSTVVDPRTVSAIKIDQDALGVAKANLGMGSRDLWIVLQSDAVSRIATKTLDICEQSKALSISGLE